MNDIPRFRFAPSPNGYLHLGHAFSALTTFKLAQEYDAEFLLRIEDIDLGRARAEFEHAIYEDLEWLGLEWVTPVRRQSEHFNVYQQALNQLHEKGLLYPCFATRKEIKEALADKTNYPLDPDGAPLYPGLYKNMPLQDFKRRQDNGEAFALRLDMDKALAFFKASSQTALQISEMTLHSEMTDRPAQPHIWGDVILARKDIQTSYHLSVVVDDALQGISHVTRGMDLYSATDLHCLLQCLLDLPSPLYYHHDLIRNEEGQKLSKSLGDVSLRDLRKQGMAPDDIRKMLGFS